MDSIPTHLHVYQVRLLHQDRQPGHLVRIDHFHQLHAGLGGGDAVLVQQLDHQPSEPLVCSGYPGGGVDFYQDVVCSSDVNLQEC